MFDIKDLLENLHVEKLDRLLFRGASLPLPLPKVFGGQVLAQSLNAAERTVDPERQAHSMHGFFLRPGNASEPIIYDVDPIRDGRSFTTRRVVAKQNGDAIFNCAVSFQVMEEGLEHQISMPPDIPQPETLSKNVERIEQVMEHNPGERYPLELPLAAVDIRSVNQDNHLSPESTDPIQGFWFKYEGKLDDKPATHRTLLSYISDKELMLTGLRPHGLNMLTPGIQLASLDHAIWFHTKFRVDDWLYYHIDSPRSAHSRDFGRGSFYTREGVLVASSAQEGLIRLR